MKRSRRPWKRYKRTHNKCKQRPIRTILANNKRIRRLCGQEIWCNIQTCNWKTQKEKCELPRRHWQENATKKEKLIYEAKKKIVDQNQKIIRNLRNFTSSFGDNALAQWKQNRNQVKNMKTQKIHNTPSSNWNQSNKFATTFRMWNMNHQQSINQWKNSSIENNQKTW